MGERHGVIRQIDGEWRLRFERRFEHPRETVWTAITGPGQMSRWFDQTQMPDPLAVGGVIRFHHEAAGMHSEGHISAVEPPRLIEWLWSGPQGPANPIRWEILHQPGGCRLILSLQVGDPAMIARTAAGWHVCLDRMEAILNGADEVGMGGWPSLFEHYAAGLEIPQKGAPPKPPTRP